MASGLSHDPQCPHCGCAVHVFLTCECGCETSSVNAAWSHAFDVRED